jgi:hypothetical protein
MPKSPYRPSEHSEQVAIVQWSIRMQGRYPELEHCLFAIPNSAKRSPQLAAYMKAEGMKAGVSDLLLLSPRGQFHGAAFELKIPGNKPTPAQLAFLDALRAQGYFTVVCYGAQAAIDRITYYLELEEKP